MKLTAVIAAALAFSATSVLACPYSKTDAQASMSTGEQKLITIAQDNTQTDARTVVAD